MLSWYPATWIKEIVNSTVKQRTLITSKPGETNWIGSQINVKTRRFNMRTDCHFKRTDDTDDSRAKICNKKIILKMSRISNLFPEDEKRCHDYDSKEHERGNNSLEITRIDNQKASGTEKPFLKGLENRRGVFFLEKIQRRLRETS